ncbi:hypothetical protein LSTR_LSTR015384 [Laodelphax striatellus]|uniref:Uncharacterized protein n=1 Tax=Laodelphax striatellus TaxID=195883 RepID=A0A482WMT3_LAOST|nr:hypothetical protein LSTR_LSTR015384 [Laodelphax striatellus]
MVSFEEWLNYCYHSAFIVGNIWSESAILHANIVLIFEFSFDSRSAADCLHTSDRSRRVYSCCYRSASQWISVTGDEYHLLFPTYLIMIRWNNQYGCKKLLGVEVNQLLEFISPATSSSFSSSVSIPGQQPIVYTHQTGAGGSTAVATAQHPNGSVSQVGSISGPRSRSVTERDDSSQQRVQFAPPPSLFQPVNFVSPNAPAPLISAASSAQAAAPPPPPGGVTSASAGSQFSASTAQQFAPSSEYGPPAAAGAIVGSFAQAAALAQAPKPVLIRIPASEYGLPGKLILAPAPPGTPAASEGSFEPLVFVPAFAPAPEGGEQAAAPPPVSSTGFFAPEGALLAPPVPAGFAASPSPRETLNRRSG